MNPFEAYAKKANTIVSRPQTLVGPIARRADAKTRYAEIVAELAAHSDPENLEIYLLTIDKEIAQFRAELDFLWEGSGDFIGLEKEIERARARVDDGLDFPRWDFEPPPGAPEGWALS